MVTLLMMDNISDVDRTKRGLRSVMMTKTKYKSLVIISPVLSFLLRNPDIYGVTFNTFNGQFVSYFMGSTIKLNCCAANVCISPPPPYLN